MDAEDLTGPSSVFSLGWQPATHRLLYGFIVFQRVNQVKIPPAIVFAVWKGNRVMGGSRSLPVIPRRTDPGR